MAEVNWKVLERRARIKRSGLAGWNATLFPRTRVVLPFKRLGREAVGGPGVEPVPACVPLESRLRSLAFLLMSTPTRAKWWWPELYYMCFSPTLFRLCSPSESSVYEPLKSINLPRPDNETLWDKLDHYYRIVKSTLLLYQSPTTGLFPTKTCGDDQKAKIQDSLYCAAGAWALALAYRRIDDDKGRTHELEHSAIKCMRGILYCYMRQADKINAVSLYLLYLVEMISSGLQIIYNTDEVSFIQNLVFCVERVYRVPDFGVWERGSKYNNGSTELHSSSVGLAKAALEAINGFNLFGNQLFDGIECEFPIFFLYMMIDGYPVIPKYYYVPADFVEYEKRNPGSQKRFPSNCGRDGKLFLWGQALYIIAKLLGISTYLFSASLLIFSMLLLWLGWKCQNKMPMCSSQDVPVFKLLLQVFLNTYGIQTQTPQQVEPIQIWAQQELVKIYRILGKTVVCYPIIFDLSDFYMSQDVLLLIDDIKNALQFIKQYWKMHGRPLFLVLIREDNIRGSRFNPILDMLASFKKGIVGGVKVHVDRLQTLISGAVVEQLDFLRISDTEELPEFKSFEELELPKHSKVKRQSSTSSAPELKQQPDIAITEWKNKSTHEILQKLNVRKMSVVRCAASLLSKLVDSLAPSITNVLVQGKQVTLGAFGHEEEVISNPLSPRVIKNIIYYKCNTHDEREAVIQQELVIHIGWIISNNPELFSGMLKIRIGWIIHAMKYELQIRSGDKPARDLYQLSPSEIKQLLLDILQPQQNGGCWLNRRQIDGSLNRTPAGFYDRVWQILERTPNGIIVAGKHLPQQPTLSDMTMYEMNFSLLVEDMLGNIDQPKYRQIVVELLMVVSIVLERNPELEFQDKVDLDKLVKEAFHEFQKDESRLKEVEKQDDMTSFYNTPPLGKRGTCSYLTKVVMNLLLEEVKPSNDDPCLVS
ncbi:hypothetical protein GH733_013148 [Mirounga leonina]|nr:hypothetical protein GH733_013148 [Mirounga leonina]